jgi:predicted ATP-grasp superfamily ATP-dependent carboligase
VARAVVFVVADEFYAALATVRGLRAAGYEPWVGSIVPDGYAQRSAAAAGVLRLPSPAEGQEQFVAAAKVAVERCRAEVVLPTSESATAALAVHSDSFDGAVVGVPSVEALRELTDKSALARLAQTAGLASPPSVEVDSLRALDDETVLAELAFPAVVKPVRSAGRRATGVHEVPDAVRVGGLEALRREVARQPDVPWLVQPFISGRLIGVAGVSENGRLLCTVHQVAHRIFPRDCGGSTYAETVPRLARLDEGLGRLLAPLGLTGIWHAQFIADGSDAYLIDFNPRPYGSLALAIAAGANLPALWVDALTGRQTQPCNYRVGRRYRAELRELGYLAHALRAADLRAALSVLVPRRHTAHAVLSVRDPAPAVRLGRRVAARIAQRGADQAEELRASTSA